MALGDENGLRFRIFGSQGSLAWSQEQPNHMVFARAGEQPRTLTRAAVMTRTPAAVAARLPSGHPEGYLEAFANLYSEIADAIAAGQVAPTGEWLFPTVGDGARGVRLMFAALRSAQT